MTIKGKAYIAGIFEHATRKADDKSLAQLHAEPPSASSGTPGSHAPMWTATSARATRPGVQGFPSAQAKEWLQSR
jgi:hypothetical protein